VSPHDKVTSHLRSLQRRLAGRTNESREALLNDLVPNLIQSLARDAGRPGIDLRGQAYEGEVGRPDFSVKDGSLLIGHLETKAPGDGADTRRFRRGTHNYKQWQRFKRLPNLLYTDGSEFALYRSGEPGPIVSLGFDENDSSQTPDPRAVNQLVELLTTYLSYRAVPPGSLTVLAERLAPLCALLRDAVLERLGESGSEVRKAAEELRTVLFPGRTDAEVADAIAQVCAYSMLLARANGARNLDASSVERALAAGHPVLGRVVTVLLDAATEEELGWALDTVRALVNVVDFARLRKSSPGQVHKERTWIYFYEDFLAKYDPRLRAQYGVYYTPAQVIHAQAELLNEVLHDELGQPDGLASPGLTILDPAVGTGSYALELLERFADSIKVARGEGAVPAALRGFAERLFAFEILVGPYAVAHLRVSETLQDFEASTPDDGPRVFLTDTLSSPYSESLSLTRQLEPLVEEQHRATKVKGEQKIVVCIGNPPYERLSAISEAGVEKGGWVVHGEGGGADSLFKHFSVPARQHTAVGHLRSLYNLYAFFWRWAIWKVFEAPNTDGTSNDEAGVISFITASSFLTGPGFLGMRQHLRRMCDELWIIDLGGDNRGARKEPNVFAIETPVAISIAIRRGPADTGTPAAVHYTRIRGSREEKLEALQQVARLSDFTWNDASTDWHAVFTPAATADWERHPSLLDLFPWQAPGPVIARTWPVTVTEENARERWNALKAAPIEEKAKFNDDKRHGRRSTTQPAGGYPPPADLSRIVDLKASSSDPTIERYGYRTLDRRWVVADSRVMRTPSQPLWAHHSKQQTYLVSMLTNVIGKGPAATATHLIPDYHFFASRGGKDVVPLYRDANGTPNLPANLLQELKRVLGEVTAEQLFAYSAAVVANSRYTETFWEHLETPGPRVPLTSHRALFERGAALGEEFLGLHTYGARGNRGTVSGGARLTRAIGPDLPDDFLYDAQRQELRVGIGAIESVTPEVYGYTVSSYEVVRNWIRGRLRHPVGRARQSDTPLDHLRPTVWTAELDVELLDLLWTIEALLKLESRQAELLSSILAGETIDAASLSEPTAAERHAPPLGGHAGGLFDPDAPEEADEELHNTDA